MRVRRFLIVCLVLTSTACSAPAAPPPTLVPTSTASPVPAFIPIPSLTPTATPRPTTTPTPTLPPSPTQVSSPISTPVPEPTLAFEGALSPDPPPRPFDYLVVNPEPPRRVPNATRTFWLARGATGQRREIVARLRAQTAHAALWVEEGVWHDVRKLDEAATFFETQIYSTTRAAFGSEWIPGVDNDPHIHVLHAAGLSEGVIGYTSSADEFPSTVYPFSNQAEMMVVDIQALEVGSPDYYALLARQLQRIIQWFQDRNEERWLKEGLAELAVPLNGIEADPLERAYLEQPDTSLLSWEDTAPHRGAAYLFALYFHQRFGDEGVRALTAQPLNGAAGFDAALAEIGETLTFEDLLAHWLAANYLDGEAERGYSALELEPPASAAVYQRYPVTADGSVEQFGADYVLLRGDSDLYVRFTGATATPLLNVSPHGGDAFWWSNRADESLATLTRPFDLSAVATATLTYWTWYDIEPGYDYATVEISADGGQQWRSLSTPSGTGDDPHGNNPGWGYTGQSGDPAGWIQESVDLSPYAGGQVLVRFTYLTDEAVTGVGFLLDDVAVPEIGYADGAENGAGGWEAAGFLRSDNLVPQRYLALLIGFGADGVAVERLPVGEDQTAEWTAPLASEGWREAALVLSGLAPLTTHPALYQLEIEE